MILKGEARIFTFNAKEGNGGAAENLKLPADARVICYYREGGFHMPAPEAASGKNKQPHSQSRANVYNRVK